MIKLSFPFSVEIFTLPAVTSFSSHLLIIGKNFINNLIILFRSQGNYNRLDLASIKSLLMILPLTVVQCERITARNQQNHISKLCRDEGNWKSNTVNILQNITALLCGLSVPSKYTRAGSCKAVLTFIANEHEQLG